MSYKNQVMIRIKEELEKELPSKRKILSYLLDLLNKSNYPSLSDFELYDIVGETYKLILDYKLNLRMLFFPIFNALKKKINKLYGKEKRLEMEQYLIDKFGLSYTEKYTKERQKQEFPPSLLTRLKYVVFSVCALIGLILFFYGLFVYYIQSSQSLGIIFMIISVIIIISGIGFVFEAIRHFECYKCCILIFFIMIFIVLILIYF